MNPLTMFKMAGWTKGLLKHDRWSREQLLGYQEQQLGKLHSYACAHSPGIKQASV